MPIYTYDQKPALLMDLIRHQIDCIVAGSDPTEQDHGRFTGPQANLWASPWMLSHLDHSSTKCGMMGCWKVGRPVKRHRLLINVIPFPTAFPIANSATQAIRPSHYCKCNTSSFKLPVGLYEAPKPREAFHHNPPRQPSVDNLLDTLSDDSYGHRHETRRGRKAFRRKRPICIGISHIIFRYLPEKNGELRIDEYRGGEIQGVLPSSVQAILVWKLVFPSPPRAHMITYPSDQLMRRSQKA